MRRPPTRAVAPLLLFALLTASAQAQTPLTIDGATGVLPLARALTTAYQASFPQVQIVVGSGLSTEERLRALADGKVEIIVASHGLGPDDIRRGNLTVVPVARGAVVFAVNETVRVSSLTEQQVCDLYSGQVKSWQGVGGDDHPVVLLTRPPTEVDPEVIRARIACFASLTEATTVRVMPRGGDMARGLAETPHAIGMTSMTVVAQSGGTIKALALNGATPTAENVQAGRYGLTREFLFVVKGQPAGAARAFLEFVRSPDGDRIILANGAVPVR